MKRIVCLAAPFALLLAGCEEAADSEGETTDQGGEAAGDVLGGTISDDMIPLEELQSQSPPAQRSERSGGNDEGDGA